jgi:hypothetical protein
LELDLEAIGWSHPSNTFLQARDLSGSLICFTQQVRFPESQQTHEIPIPGPIIVVVSESDGSNARLVALSFDIGGGPCFDFTSDAMYVLGGPLLGCLPTPESFAAYVTREDDSQLLLGYLVDVETGERSGDARCVMSDGHYANPWSDLVATGAYPPNMIADAVTQEVLVEVSEPGSSGVVDCWVLPDAGLASNEGTQVLRYSDGTEVINPGSEIHVYAVLSDGSCVFSRDDVEGARAPALLGNIDWHTFESADAETLLGLEEYYLRHCDVLDDETGRWLVFVDGSTLFSYELP